MKAVKINSLELENVKRIKAVAITPTDDGLTIIGGDNLQGKTSVLDAIAWALGGDRFKPSSPMREGSVVEPHLKVTLSNGIVVERSGKNGALKVTDSTGNKGGQALLNEFIETLALDLPKFIRSSAKEKADTLLHIIGVGDKLYELESAEQSAYNQRRMIGQIADQKEKHAKEMVAYPNVPKEPVSALELIHQQQNILAKNGENQRKRNEKERFDRELAEAQIAFDKAKAWLKEAEANALSARKSAENLQDESTAELEENIRNVDAINMKVRANNEREKAELDAEGYRAQYNKLTSDIESLRTQRLDLLKGANMPLADLSVENGELTYQGKKWDCMSGSQKLMVATAIVRKLNPKCGFVLIDELEAMDMKTIKAFAEWLETEGLQVIATRVSTGEECSVIIEDGYSRIPTKTEEPKWTEGVF